MSFLGKLLGTVSGNTGLQVSEQLLFDKVIGFKGLTTGVGTSTIVQNVAAAISNTSNYSVCILDTSYLYPTLYPMLVDTPDTKRLDYLEFTGNLQELVTNTKLRNTYLLSLYNRGILDMLSSRDSDVMVNKVIGALKTYYDIVLVDLSNEPTNIATHAAIKCNKIFLVSDISLKCTYNIRKTMNTLGTLAIPKAKVQKVILNKDLRDVSTNIDTLFKEADLELVGRIPLSREIATLGVAGKQVWSPKSDHQDIVDFSNEINKILIDIIQITPLNAKYTNPEEVKKEKVKWKDRKSKSTTKETTTKSQPDEVEQ